VQHIDLFWENYGWESEDKHLKAVKKMPFSRKWPFIPSAPGLYIIRGPRQVGKTSWLKSILAAHCATKKCFYLSCEEIIDFRDLSRMLGSLKDRDLIILDEVSFIDGWDRSIKHFVDSGYDGILCLSGSHAYDLERGADLMPGRFGEGGDFQLLPMTFDEFEDARRQANWHTNDRIAELQAYFRSGGFPLAVSSAGKSGRPSKAVCSTYLKWILGDAKKLGKDTGKIEEILIQIYKTMQSPISFQTLAKKTSIGSPNTVIDYIRVLESSFCLRTLYAIDPNTGARKHKSDKKFYFTDPLIYWIAADLAGDSSPKNAEEVIAELTAHEHLSRIYQRFGYYLTSSGEIDFMASHKWAVEVKWTQVVTSLSKTFHNTMLPQKIVWSQTNFLDQWPQ
jgi:uncharacterized protein